MPPRPISSKISQSPSTRPVSASPLAQKLKLKPGQRIAILNAPAGYVERLAPLPAGVTRAPRLQGAFDWIQLFVKNQAELGRRFPAAAAALKPEGLLWLCFPKGTSAIQTDLTRDQGWEAAAAAKLKWVTLVSVDETWSAFAVRAYKPGEPRQSFR